MGKIRPVYNNFAAGEISPKLAGRSDLPVFQAGASRMKNMKPERLGGASKRGGFKYIAKTPVDDSARLIPWSINDELDLILVLSDGAINILDVSYGHTPAFLATDPAATSGTLPITELRTIGGSPAYAEADIAAVKYAQNMRSIYLAHPDYPLFYIKYVDYDSVTGYISLEYGPVMFEGSIASSTLIDAAVGVTDVIPATYLMGALSVLQADIVYDIENAGVSGSINNKPLVSITKIETTTPRYFHYSYDAGWQAGKVSGDKHDGDTGLPIAVASDGWFVGPSESYTIVKFTDTDTATQILDKLKAKLEPGIQYHLRGERDGPLNIDYRGGIEYYNEKTERSYKLGLADTIGAATLSIATPAVLTRAAHGLVTGNMVYLSTTGALPTGLLAGKMYWVSKIGNDTCYLYQTYADAMAGTNRIATSGTQSGTHTLYKVMETTIDAESSTLLGYMTMDTPKISVNKNATPGTDIMERVAPWLTPDKVYLCDGSIAFNGGTPVSAMKDVSGEEPAIVVTFSDSSEIRVTASSTGLTGQLNVILTPFYDRNDNPGFVTFHQGRMVVGGSRIEPNVFFMSQSNDHSNFKYFEDVEYEKTTPKPASEWADPDQPEYTVEIDTVQQIGAASAIRMQLSTDENEAIQWAASIQDLVIGTVTSEWVVPANVNAIDSRVVLTSRNGSADIQGRFVKGSIMFVPHSRKGAKVFQPAVGQTTESATEHAEHLFTDSSYVVGMDFRQDPGHEVLITLSDGRAVVGVFGSDVVGWMPLETRAGDVIESMVAITSMGEDAIYAVVKRVIDGGHEWYIERLVTTDDATFSGRRYLDSFVEDAPTAGVISGLDRFVGQAPTVIIDNLGGAGVQALIAAGTPLWGVLDVLGNGTASQYTPDGTTTKIDLPDGEDCIIGYPYEAVLQLPRIDQLNIDGLPKTAGPVHIRVRRSGDFFLRKTDAEGDDMYLQGGVLLDQSLVPMPGDITTGYRVYPYSGVLRTEAFSGATEDQFITLASKSPEPMNIQLVAPTYSVGEIE